MSACQLTYFLNIVTAKIIPQILVDVKVRA